MTPFPLKFFYKLALLEEAVIVVDTFERVMIGYVYIVRIVRIPNC